MRIRPTSERPTGLTRYVVSATVTDGPIGFADSQTATVNFTATSIFAKSFFQSNRRSTLSLAICLPANLLIDLPTEAWCVTAMIGQ